MGWALLSWLLPCLTDNCKAMGNALVPVSVDLSQSRFVALHVVQGALQGAVGGYS